MRRCVLFFHKEDFFYILFFTLYILEAVKTFKSMSVHTFHLLLLIFIKNKLQMTKTLIHQSCNPV